MEDKYYAILYRLINLGEEYRIYTPINVVVGTYIENQFLDEAGNTYLDVQMLDAPLENADYRVGNETLEIDLKEKYPNDNDENLKMYFFDLLKNNILIGILVPLT